MTLLPLRQGRQADPALRANKDRPTMQPQKEPPMDKYECSICGYVYDPAAGDPDNGVAPGTKFEDIPEEWVCPVCGAPKSEFNKA